MIAKISAPILMRAFAETEWHRSQIVGFTNHVSGAHWIRDVSLEPGQQTLWTHNKGLCGYERTHALMMEEIERLKMQIVCDWLADNHPVTTRDI